MPPAWKAKRLIKWLILLCNVEVLIFVMCSETGVNTSAGHNNSTIVSRVSMSYFSTPAVAPPRSPSPSQLRSRMGASSGGAYWHERCLYFIAQAVLRDSLRSWLSIPFSQFAQSFHGWGEFAHDWEASCQQITDSPTSNSPGRNFLPYTTLFVPWYANPFFTALRWASCIVWLALLRNCGNDTIPYLTTRSYDTTPPDQNE